MFPWNKNLWMFARATNYNPTTSLYTRHNSGYYLDLVRTSQRNTSESENPLLILQTAGEPTKASKM